MSGGMSIAFATAAAIGAILPPWAFWVASVLCLIAASFTTWLTERKKIEALQSVDTAVTIQRLTELANYGTNNLQNRPVQNNDADVYHLWADYGVWEQKLISTMEQCRCKTSDITRIKQLNTFMPRGLVGTNDAHTQVKEWLAEKVARLREIIRQIEQ